MIRWMIVLAALGTKASLAENWPMFRGDGHSQAPAADLPLNWSAETNLAWQHKIKGFGQSSPVVWGRQVFVTSALGKEKETLMIEKVNLAGGKSVWIKKFASSVKTPVSNYVSRSAPTPAVDADCVYAFFESGDVFALDHKGNKVWSRSLTDDYGAFEGNHGLGSSPALTENAVILLIDHSGPSYLLALDKKTGKTLWKTGRQSRVSWSSPVVAAGPGGGRIFLSSNGSVEAYSADKGKRIWQVTGIEGNTVASPSVSENFVIVGSSERGHNLAIKRGGQGDVTETHIAWRNRDATSSFGSPLIHQSNVYFVNRAGGLVCAELKTGETKWKARLPASCWASPVGAGERVYFFTKDGAARVMSSVKEKKSLAENALTISGRLYGVASVKGNFLIRTGSRLTCIRKSNSPAKTPSSKSQSE